MRNRRLISPLLASLPSVSLYVAALAIGLLSLGTPHASNAAELRVSEGTVVVEDGIAYVDVNVSWRLSWNDATNYDAAWLFVNVPRRRGGIPLKLAPSGHRTLRNAHPDQPDAAFDVAADSLGTFVYRDAQADGRGPNDWRLRLQIALPDDVEPSVLPETVEVYGVEMVYVPKGPFYAGDPQPPTEAPTNSLFEVTSDTASSPAYRIDDDGPIRVCDGPGTLCYPKLDNPYDSLRVGDMQGPIPETFPTGYDAFYLMKYELTQGQYVDFLNSMSGNQHAQRSPIGAAEYRSTRGSIEIVSDGYVAGRPDRACNHLSWADAAAWADWARLRPMTELEYEKAARGPADPVPNEYAWGSTRIAHGDTLYTPDSTVARTEDGDEWIPGNANYGPSGSEWIGGYNHSITGGDEGRGPLRVDVFETHAHRTGGENLPDATMREASGAGYYGAVGLTGSLFERVVTLGDPTGRAFTGSHGDGSLAYPAGASNDDWPPMNADGLGLRGGWYGDTPEEIHTAQRKWGDYDAHYRAKTMGFRAARSQE